MWRTSKITCKKWFNNRKGYGVFAVNICVRTQECKMLIIEYVSRKINRHFVHLELKLPFIKNIFKCRIERCILQLIEGLGFLIILYYYYFFPISFENFYFHKSVSIDYHQRHRSRTCPSYRAGHTALSGSRRAPGTPQAVPWSSSHNKRHTCQKQRDIATYFALFKKARMTKMIKMCIIIHITVLCSTIFITWKEAHRWTGSKCAELMRSPWRHVYHLGHCMTH